MSIKKIITAATILGFVVGCQQENPGIESKKNELYTLREQLKETDKRIAKLEDEIRSEDPSFENQLDRATLVTTIAVSKQEFQHKMSCRAS